MLIESRPCFRMRERGADRGRRAVAHPAAALSADVAVVPCRCSTAGSGQLLMNPCHETSDQSSFLICAQSSAVSRAGLIGLESQP